MIYQQLYNKAKRKDPVKFALIGAGSFGSDVIGQSLRHPLLRASAAVDLRIDLARKAYTVCGVSEDDIVFCDSPAKALAAMEANKYIITDDAMVLMELPIDAIVEGTGIPEAGAFFGYNAIKNGKHFIMVNKEADSVVAPILKYEADRAGVVYTAAEGDQPGLILGMLSWASNLSFDVLCAGKFRDLEIGFNNYTKEFDFGLAGGPKFGHPHYPGDEWRPPVLRDEDRWALELMEPGRELEFLQKRYEIMSKGNHTGVLNFDICELVVVANASNLIPDTPTTHTPFVRMNEVAHVLCLEEDGGLLKNKGVIDAVTPIRDSIGMSAGGGVFIVVDCGQDYSGRALAGNTMTNKNGTATVFVRPHHMTGLETPTSILVAGILGVPTGGDVVKPRYDMVRRPYEDLKAGYEIYCGTEHVYNMEALILPAQMKSPDAPIPWHLADGCKLKCDVPAGTIITYDMVEEPKDNFLWNLRKRQDELFLKQGDL